MIRAIIETSLIDWDGKITTVLFFDACNFKCPFCHNWELMKKPENYPEVTWDVIVKALNRKQGWVDGVVLTGGEPLVHKKEVLEIASRIKNLGIKVKIDTNGAYPNVLEEIIERNLVDYVAMDIKAPLDKAYNDACGVHVDIQTINRSIEILLKGNVDYEFRTTCVPGIIDKAAIHKIGQTIKGAKRWVLQAYVPDNAHIEDFRKPLEHGYPTLLKTYQDIAQQYVPETILRGKV